MSGFLNDLIARSQGTLTVLEPRRPSIYEPHRPRSGSLGMQDVGESRIVEDARPTAERPVPETPGVEGPELPVQRPIRAAPVSRFPIDQEDNHIPAQPLDAPKPADDFVASTRRALPERKPGSEAEFERIEAIPPVVDTVYRAPMEAMPPSASRGDRNLLRVAAADTIRGDPRPSSPRRNRREASPVRWERPEPLNGRSAEVRRDAEPASIHVTVGRVDVRAVLPAPPAAPAAPAKSRRPLSLAEYLKERDGGQR